MRTTLVRGSELTQTLCEQWRRMQENHPLLASPYCCPEYTMLVASVRRDVWVAVIEDGGRTVGFFPFQRNGKRGTPVGGALSDCQALIREPQVSCDPRELIRQCGLSLWDFDHLLGEQTEFADHITRRDESPCMDLSKGYDAYVQSRKTDGGEIVQTTQRKARKLAREVGHLRYVGMDLNSSSLETLLRWKSQQYLRTGKIDAFGFPWVVKLMHGLLAARGPGFQGRLSTLYAGDRLVAAHLGMQSRWVHHYWFPAYDVEVQQYSPGIILLLRMAEEGAAQGLAAMDLGKGQAVYKDRLRSYAVPLAEGSVQVPSLRTVLRNARARTEAWVRRTPLAHVVRLPGRLILAAERRRRFE